MSWTDEDTERWLDGVLAHSSAHDFEALEDSTLLLTLAWTGHRPDRPPRAGRRGTAH